MTVMLMKAARRNVLVGTRPGGDIRRCNCWECATTKTKSAQRALERRRWRQEESA